MTQTGENGGDETARLEAALARIARAGRPGQAATPGEARTATSTKALAARLDALISDLRAVLGGDSAD